jgi:hypothetical protein
MYSSTLSLTSALDGCGKRHASATLPPGKTPWYPLYRRLGGPPGPVWTGAEILAPSPGFDSRTVQPVASRYTDELSWLSKSEVFEEKSVPLPPCSLQNLHEVPWGLIGDLRSKRRDGSACLNVHVLK